MTPFDQFRNAVLTLDMSEGLSDWPESLLMRREGEWATYYAPFDHINSAAKVVLVGITPGLQQAGNALSALQRELRNGVPHAEALSVAKQFASFSGPMRQNLIDLLDSIGLNEWLGMASTNELFGSRANLVHYTSALRYPVTLKGKNYGGTPSIVRSAYARTELTNWFAPEAAQLKEAVFVPLGPAVSDALDFLVTQGKLSADRVLGGLPHPSGANAERIAYFTGRKPRHTLSTKTDPAKLDRARDHLVSAVRRLRVA